MITAKETINVKMINVEMKVAESDYRWVQ